MADDNQQPTDPTVEPYLALALGLRREHIAGDEEEHIAKQVTLLRGAVEAIDAVPLTNADEPEPRFAAYRDEP